MEKEWFEEYAFGPLEQFQEIAPGLYMQRTNETILPPEGEEGSFDYMPTRYRYLSRKISKEQYDSYMDMLHSPAQAQLMNDFRSVTENQNSLNGQSLVTMAAMADLYELLTAFMANMNKDGGV